MIGGLGVVGSFAHFQKLAVDKRDSRRVIDGEANNSDTLSCLNIPVCHLQFVRRVPILEGHQIEIKRARSVNAQRVLDKQQAVASNKGQHAGKRSGRKQLQGMI